MDKIVKNFLSAIKQRDRVHVTIGPNGVVSGLEDLFASASVVTYRGEELFNAIYKEADENGMESEELGRLLDYYWELAQ